MQLYIFQVLSTDLSDFSELQSVLFFVSWFAFNWLTVHVCKQVYKNNLLYYKAQKQSIAIKHIGKTYTRNG